MNVVNLLKDRKSELNNLLPAHYTLNNGLKIDLGRKKNNIQGIQFKDLPDLVFNKIRNKGKKFAYGGYNEDRSFYEKSKLFHGEGEARSIHLGIDIWVEHNTSVYAPLEGIIHSFANNTGFGNYGPTIITEHLIEGCKFYLLFGHLTVDSLNNLKEGYRFDRGHLIGRVGNEQENGNWPPHLHLQLITDLLGNSGDFTGVCEKSKANFYLSICPDPMVFL